MKKAIPERAWPAICAIAGSRLKPDATTRDIQQAFAVATVAWLDAVMTIDENPVTITAKNQDDAALLRLRRGTDWDFAFEIPPFNEDGEDEEEDEE